ncbi:hypothetical protein [Pontibacter ruber]|uniref:hypothetical protein n=1 Tax=Pontibacter ruber TaxID=1343895 RepID=UPI00202973D9|nr:hypothetical protein [Pontibacter ruber]
MERSAKEQLKRKKVFLFACFESKKLLTFAAASQKKAARLPAGRLRERRKRKKKRVAETKNNSDLCTPQTTAGQVGKTTVTRL